MKTIRGLLLVAVIAGASCVEAAPIDRIQTPVDNRVRSRLSGNVHPVSPDAMDLGSVPASHPLPQMTLFFNCTAEQQAELDSLLAQQQEPSSPNYHQWLTPEQFGQRFGVSEADMAKAAQWLRSQGFTILEGAPSRNYIVFSGTAAQAEAAFTTDIHSFIMPDGNIRFANVQEPSLPRALAEVTLSVQGLHNFGPKPRAAVRPRFTSSISGNHFLVPDDVQTIYDLKPLYGMGIDGTNQTIAVTGQTAIQTATVDNWRSLSGLPANTPQVVVATGGNASFISSDDLGEAYLDVEWPGAVAINAKIIYVNGGQANSVFTGALQYAISHNVAQVVSTSYGNCEANWSQVSLNSFSSLFQQANAQGQTVVGPSGDEGAADCEDINVKIAVHGLAVDFPASSPYVTGVGGSLFNDGSNPSQYWLPVNNAANGSALSYIPETVWNETTANQGQIAAAGGGKSTAQINGSPNSKPAWQAALTPSDGVRDVPDISLAAGFIHDSYLICASGQTPGDCTNGYRDSNSNLDAIGGTSAGVPVFAGMVALLNQKMGAAQGNINPALYSLAAKSGDAFHDIVSGDNVVPCGAGTKLQDGTVCPQSGRMGYVACPGYDYASGLGSPDATNMIMELAGSAAPAGSPDFTFCPAAPTTLTVAHGNSATITVSVVAMFGFNGTVTYACSVPASLVGVTCTPPGAGTAPANAAFTITASSTAKLMPPGGTPNYLAWNWGGGLLVGGLLLGAGEKSKKKKSRSLRTLLLGGAVLLLLFLLAGCGGGSSATSNAAISTPESGTITLQGTSNGTTHSVPITVNVN